MKPVWFPPPREGTFLQTFGKKTIEWLYGILGGIGLKKFYLFRRIIRNALGLLGFTFFKHALEIK